MTRRLILMRHAKSGWDDPTLDDHARPLNERGRHAAEAVGDWLRENRYLPDAILSSSAQRTRETAERLGLDVPARFCDALYLAGPERMLTHLRREDAAVVLMLGHNPGIAAFAALLLARRPQHARFADYPTCATLIAEFAIDDWSHLRYGTGRAVDFVVPRDLTD